MPQNRTTFILGIDPGLQKTGWGVITCTGAELKHIGHGTIRPDTTQDMAARLTCLAEELEVILEHYKPQMAAIEETFVNRNPATSLKLGMARGAVIATLGRSRLEMAEYTPNTVKKSIVGRGHADKAQIAMMVKILLPNCGAMGPDAADALAIALTHAHYSHMTRVMNTA